jgi:6-pyruvoyltetrahydropterin/6-carboxytetrahydropterin synthase
VSWTLRKTVRFEAAHHLPHHDGKCRRVHGHSWEAVIEVRGRSLWQDGPKTGMVMDYGEISQAVDPIWEDYLDHHDLNATTGLDSPTSERLAKWLFDTLAPHLYENLVAVTIRETCTSECRYEGD